MASVIRTEQGLLGVTELLEYFQMKHPNVLIQDFDLQGEHLGEITETHKEYLLFFYMVITTSHLLMVMMLM